MHKPQDAITAFWDGPTNVNYDASAFHGLRTADEKQAWLDALRELVGPPPLDVLDVGTGTGFLALLLAEIGHQVTGIDLSEKMLGQARRKAATIRKPPTFLIGDANDPPMSAATFDVVIGRHVVWTLLDPIGAATKWLKLLRPKGRVIVIEWFTPDSDWSPYPAEVGDALPLRKMASPDVVVAAFHKAGFTTVRSERLGGIERIEREVASEESEPAPDRCAVIAEAAELSD